MSYVDTTQINEFLFRWIFPLLFVLVALYIFYIIVKKVIIFICSKLRKPRKNDSGSRCNTCWFFGESDIKKGVELHNEKLRLEKESKKNQNLREKGRR